MVVVRHTNRDAWPAPLCRNPLWLWQIGNQSFALHDWIPRAGRIGIRDDPADRDLDDHALEPELVEPTVPESATERGWSELQARPI